MKKILIVLADYYDDISSLLLKSAKNRLNKFSLKIIRVPGVFEIPVTISKNIKKYDAFIALGCVIKGKTAHFDLITNAVTNSLINLSVLYKKPIGNGIITALDIGQAGFRSSSEVFPKGSKINKPNKGTEAARAVLSVLGILKNESK